MTTRRRIAVVAACVVVALLAAWYAGSRPPGPAPVAAGSVRLGPDPGESIEGYLARLPAELPAPGAPVLAMVQFAPEQTAAGAVEATAGFPLLTAVFRVPLPRVQTALRFEQLEPGNPADVVLTTARQRAQQAAAGDALRSTGRPRDVAATEAAALSAPDCRCVLALVVRADRAGLAALSGRPGVRAVQAAPAGVVLREVALAPLLPEQTSRADPLPDDGPVPPA